MAGVEYVFELWVGDDEDEQLREDFLQEQAEELLDTDLCREHTALHGAHSASPPGVGGAHRRSQLPKARQQHERLLKAYRGDPGVAGWFPGAPRSVPFSAAAPPSWQHAQTSLEWLPAPQSKQPFSAAAALQHDPSSAAGVQAAQQQLMRARSEGLDIQQALDAVPTMATITSVSPACIYLPPGLEDSSVCLAVTGTHLGDVGCQLLGRSKLASSHDMQVQQLVRKSATVQVTVHHVSSPSCLLLEARMNQLVSQSRAVLLVDDAAMAHELQQPQRAHHPSAAATGEPTVNDALIRDLGTWLEYCHEKRTEQVGSTDPAIQGLQYPQLTSGGLHTSDADLGSGVSSAVAQINSLLPGGRSLQGQQRSSLAAVQHAQSMKKTMTRLGVHLLEHAVGAGWCAVSTRIMHELMEVQGLCMDTIFRLACSQGLPLLHRAICSSHIQMLHTVLRWGDATDHEWDLANLVPTRNRRGSEVYVSALHLAAALSDHGYAAELLLLKYGEARKLWSRVRDSRGLLPCQYAAVAGNQHLDVLANRLLEAPERPLGPADQSAVGQRRTGLGCDELPKLAALNQQSSGRVKGRRVPRASAAPGISPIGRFLEQAQGEVLPPPPTSFVEPPGCVAHMEQRWQLLGDDEGPDMSAEAVGVVAEADVVSEVEAGDTDAVSFGRPAMASWATDTSSTLVVQGSDSTASLAQSLGLPPQAAPDAIGPLNSATTSLPRKVESKSSAGAAHAASRQPRWMVQSRWVWAMVAMAWLAIHLPLLRLLPSFVLPASGESSVLTQLVALLLAAIVEAAVALAFKSY